MRLEAAMPMYGHELSETNDPISAGLRFAVAPSCVPPSPSTFRGPVRVPRAPHAERVGRDLRGTQRGGLRDACQLRRRVQTAASGAGRAGGASAEPHRRPPRDAHPVAVTLSSAEVGVREGRAGAVGGIVHGGPFPHVLPVPGRDPRGQKSAWRRTLERENTREEPVVPQSRGGASETDAGYRARYSGRARDQTPLGATRTCQASSISTQSAARPKPASTSLG